MGNRYELFVKKTGEDLLTAVRFSVLRLATVGKDRGQR